jgi:hypothetical protein
MTASLIAFLFFFALPAAVEKRLRTTRRKVSFYDYTSVEKQHYIFEKYQFHFSGTLHEQ